MNDVIRPSDGLSGSTTAFARAGCGKQSTSLVGKQIGDLWYCFTCATKRIEAVNRTLSSGTKSMPTSNLSNEQLDELLFEINDVAREVSVHDYGLPVMHLETMATLRIVVQVWLTRHAHETFPVHPDPTGKTREPPHCPSCNCGAETRADEGFQARVYDWMAKCFMRPDSMLPVQRSFRFVEEALELAQASGTSREEVLRLVEYVYGRPAGLIGQEIGGVMVTLSGLATSFGLSMEYAGNAELARCEENTEKIRAKDVAKPQRSPLPGPTSEKASEHCPDPVYCSQCGQEDRDCYCDPSTPPVSEGDQQ